MNVRESPPLAVSVEVTATDGRQFRWSPDAPHGADIPDDLRFSDTVPGGFETADCSLPRDPSKDYADLGRLSTLTVRGVGGGVAWQGRLERAPRTSGDRVTVSPSAVGWQAALADNKAASMVYIDQTMAGWQEPSTARKAAIAAVPNSQGKIPVSVSEGIVWDVPNEALPAGETSEYYLDSGAGNTIARIAYQGARSGTWTNLEAAAIYPCDSATLANVDTVALTLDNTLRAQSFTSARRWLMLRARVGVAHTPAVGVQQRYTVLIRYGDHGLTIRGSGTSQGLYASDIVLHAVRSFAPALTASTTTVLPSGFIVPQLSFGEPTSCGEMIKQATRFGLQDWGVWDDRTFWWYERGSLGRRWRARASTVRLEETGPQVDRVWESIVVRYRDVNGSTKTVGPPGSGADVESADLKDSDPLNPANQAGIIRRDLLDMGSGMASGAIEVGRRFLEETRLLDKSGRARIVGYVENDSGVACPYWEIRAGDYISFVDTADTSYRRIVRTDKTVADRSCSIDLDAPPEGLQALLERLGVVLVPLGIS